ncbi:hypothetical protein DRQ07_05275 [candidate division KSB1 bacterium]|nr:MAG: hypothetical protein DRQ07_05275 [candidate division KSB1 bacterium]
MMIIMIHMIPTMMTIIIQKLSMNIIFTVISGMAMTGLIPTGHHLPGTHIPIGTDFTSETIIRGHGIPGTTDIRTGPIITDIIQDTTGTT